MMTSSSATGVSGGGGMPLAHFTHAGGGPIGAVVGFGRVSPSSLSSRGLHQAHSGGYSRPGQQQQQQQQQGAGRASSPTVSSSSKGWSDEENQRLQDAVKTWGTSSWAKVAAVVGNGRAVQACRGRWRRLVAQQAQAAQQAQHLPQQQQQQQQPSSAEAFVAAVGGGGGDGRVSPPSSASRKRRRTGGGTSPTAFTAPQLGPDAV